MFEKEDKTEIRFHKIIPREGVRIGDVNKM